LGVLQKLLGKGKKKSPAWFLLAKNWERERNQKDGAFRVKDKFLTEKQRRGQKV